MKIRESACDFACSSLVHYLLQVIFEFISGIEKNLASKLKFLGIIVNGEILPNSSNEDFDEYSESSSEDSYENRYYLLNNF